MQLALKWVETTILHRASPEAMPSMGLHYLGSFLGHCEAQNFGMA